MHGGNKIKLKIYKVRETQPKIQYFVKVGND